MRSPASTRAMRQSRLRIWPITYMRLSLPLKAILAILFAGLALISAAQGGLSLRQLAAIGEAATARTTTSSLNAHKSSRLPPPRVSKIRSTWFPVLS